MNKRSKGKDNSYDDRRVPRTKCELLPMIKQTLVQAVSLRHSSVIYGTYLPCQYNIE